MIPVFAAEIPDMVWEMAVVGILVVAVAATAKAVNEIGDLINRFRDKPSSSQLGKELREWAEKHFATKEELAHAREIFSTTLVNQDTRLTNVRTDASRIEQSVSEIKALVITNEARHEQRAIDLHNRINPLLTELGAAKERLRSHSQRLHGAA